MIETTLKTLLSPVATTYPVTIPIDPVLPCLDYKIITSVKEGTFTGRGTTKFRVEVNCWGGAYADAVGLRNAVSIALDGYYDGNVTIRELSQQDFFEQTLLQYRAQIEFYVFATQP